MGGDRYAGGHAACIAWGPGPPRGRGFPSVSTTSNLVGHAVDRTGRVTRAAALDLATQVLKLVNTVRAAEARTFDGMLSRIGLERRGGHHRAAWFTAGAATAGAAVFFLTATPTGQAIRQRIRRFVADEMDTVAAEAKTLGVRVGAVFRGDAARESEAPRRAVARQPSANDVHLRACWRIPDEAPIVSSWRLAHAALGKEPARDENADPPEPYHRRA